MFLRSFHLSLATVLLSQSSSALKIDVENPNSIKSAAKTIAGGIVSLYGDRSTSGFIPGLFPEPYFWWEAGIVFNSLIDYSYLTGDHQYDDLVAEALTWQIGEEDNLNAFMPLNQTTSLANDDQSSWGLAAMAAAEANFTTSRLAKLDGKLSWIDLAVNVFETQVPRWNTQTCGGGFNWQIYEFNNGYSYKSTAAEANFFLLSARLAKFTGNSTYSDWAAKAFDWTKQAGLITDNYNVYDGADEQKGKGNCSQIQKVQWSSNLGLFLEGSAIMYNLTGGNDKWKNEVTGFAKNIEIFQKDKVLVESACETNGKCNLDQRAFKGLAARALSHAAQAAPFVSELVTPVIEASAKAAAGVCDDTKTVLQCSQGWASKKTDLVGLGESYSALSVVQALLLPGAKPSSSNSTLNGSSGQGTQNQESNGSSKTEENTGAASALTASGYFIVPLVALGVVFL